MSHEIDALERKIEEQIAKAESAKTVNIVIVIVLMLVMGGYMTWLRAQVVSLTTPESISLMTVDAVRSRLPDIRQEIGTTIRREGPKFVDETVSNLIRRVPEGRLMVQGAVEDLANRHADEVERELDKMFAQTMAQHGDQIRGFSAELATDEGAKKFEDFMYEMLTQELREPKLRSDIEGYGLFLVNLSNRIKYLVDNQNLTNEDRVARDFLIVMRELSARSPKYVEVKESALPKAGS